MSQRWSAPRATLACGVICAMAALVVLLLLQQRAAVDHTAMPDANQQWVTLSLRPLPITLNYPANWHYRENHVPTAMHWIISRESPATTAPRVAIAVMAMKEVSLHRGHPVAEEVAQWLAAYRQGGTAVTECSADGYVIFEHACLERDTTRFIAGQPVPLHERSVVLWLDEPDALMILQVQAPVSEWAAQQAILLRMQASLIVPEHLTSEME